jgi:hypothetical protein
MRLDRRLHCLLDIIHWGRSYSPLRSASAPAISW